MFCDEPFIGGKPALGDVTDFEAQDNPLNIL